ncbi:MAG: PQQ-binding-like beta-propeller repeat protein [Daejeonella sp.]|uniref:outer membrane protein assembly factor BamB family protein n=1 Tax=Daejeonella sp. TaxID=2805397 RepID=UPI002733A51A|nr:PQQ-binding-like beta-propeller repeat protein [Daejeonella sp.]MDP3469052.1 PQQ-binding-like beta-propeller repeat protein [Daejeonella sp.]
MINRIFNCTKSITNSNNFSLLFLVIASCFISCDNSQSNGEWGVYAGGKERLGYSSLKQIDTSNVKDLKVAWVYHTKDADQSSQMQTNSLIVDGILYAVSPQLKLFAADAASGKELWVFDPIPSMLIDNAGRQSFGLNVCRGIVLHKGKNNEHLIFYTAGSSLYCINSATGKPVSTFGKEGRISLYDNLELNRDVNNLRVTSTSAGIIYQDLIIMGSSLSEEEEAAPGHIRAYDIHTSEMKWLFRTIPSPGDIGFDSWEDPEAHKYVGSANAWGGFSLDEKRGIVYTATGTSNPDFYGGKRKGDNLFSNSILALDAATGKYIWHFQAVHHDLWDWDFPSAPSLVTVKKEGKKIDALVQTSKQGFIYLLDRITGKPIYPIVEKAVPIDTDLDGEQPSPTQPIPTVIPAFSRQSFTEADLNRNIPDSSFQDLKKRFNALKNNGMFTPPSISGTLVLPGLTGGAEWGGPSVDPESGIMYINANELPWIISMQDTRLEKPVKAAQTNLDAGKTLYVKNCQGCHGVDLKGSGNFPALLGLNNRFKEEDFKVLVSSGRKMMPAFKNLGENDKTALASYLLNLESKQKETYVPEVKQRHPFYNTPYRLAGIRPFLTKEGYPGIAPPWGTLSAIDLNTGRLVWRKTLGDHPEMKAKGIHSGTENWGGSVVTAGGLVFIAATSDEMFRAYNKTTGELLFETKLPAGGYATPSVYSVKGKQYVVIACGGGKMRTKSADTYVAFSLPD